MEKQEILKQIEKEIDKLESRITYLEGKEFYNSIKKQTQKEAYDNIISYFEGVTIEQDRFPHQSPEEYVIDTVKSYKKDLT